MIVVLVIYAVYAVLLSPVLLLLWAWYRVFATPASPRASVTRSVIIATALLPTLSYGLPFTLMFVYHVPLVGMKGTAETLWLLWGCIAASAAGSIVSIRHSHPVRMPLVVASIGVAVALSLLLVLSYGLLLLPHG